MELIEHRKAIARRQLSDRRGLIACKDNRGFLVGDIGGIDITGKLRKCTKCYGEECISQPIVGDDGIDVNYIRHSD